jgi:hypothetical protein
MEERKTLRLAGSKLVARDITDNLGKLPPQAIDLEQAVLGAMMLEVRSIEILPFLKPDHFYEERHRQVMIAIRQLHEAGVHPDMRMVRSHLTTLGTLELVGGAFYLAELTSSVQSSANIEHHARVIVELAMKRNLIQISSRIQSLAYEDTQDVFNLLQQTQQDLKFLEERETTNSGPERAKQLWERFRISAQPARAETLIKLGDTDVCTVGNISLLVGKKKSRKSLLVTLLLSYFLKSRNNLQDDLAVFDTEQEEYDVWQAMDRLYRMTNMIIPIFCLRGLNPKERREFIELTVKHWHRPLKIIVIDGVRDCMSNINDPDETTEVISWQMRLNVEHRVHIMDILHLNKTDNNARGHIGTELLNKAEITIEVEYDQKTTYSQVKCESSRRKPFETFMFTHGPTGLPEVVGAVIGSEVQNSDEQIKRLSAVFEGELLRNKEVREGICAQCGVGDNKARKLLADFMRNGWIAKSGPDRSPNTVYKLNVAPGTYTPSTVAVKQAELDLTPTPPTLNTPDTTEDLPF